MNPDLERALRDERELRAALEQRLAAEVEKASTWRIRAEERAERIERLQTELRRGRSPLGALRRWLSAAQTPATAPASPRIAPPPAVSRRAPRLASLSLAGRLGDPGRQPVQMETRWTDLAQGSIAGAELVLLDSSGWAALPEGRKTTTIADLERPGTPPVVWWGDGLDVLPEALQSAITTVIDLPPTFDPPEGRPRLEEALVEDESSSEWIAAAGGGRPLTPWSDDGERDRASVGARRWALRHHAPWVRLSAILSTAGVEHVSPLPMVGAVLVSNRPDRIQPAIASMAAQSYPLVDLVVVLHGFDVGEEDLRGASTVIRAPESWTLGRCLNEGVEATRAGVIAKIDDDDDYGSHHLEDSVHALLTSDAGVVGKAAMYVYLAGEDRTVLRRAGDEERDISGTMPGGSLVFHRRVWDAVRFPHRPRFVDTAFLAGARAIGERVRSGHRFEFCLVRHEQGHTYEASTDVFLAGAQSAWDGHHPECVEVPDVDVVD